MGQTISYFDQEYVEIATNLGREHKKTVNQSWPSVILANQITFCYRFGHVLKLDLVSA